MSPVTVSTSGIGVAHLPNQRHKIVTNKGTNFTIMVCGESGLGKTTFINTLFTTIIKEPKDQSKRWAKQLDRTVDIEITKTGKNRLLFYISQLNLLFRNWREKVQGEVEYYRYTWIWWLREQPEQLGTHYWIYWWSTRELYATRAATWSK